MRSDRRTVLTLLAGAGLYACAPKPPARLKLVLGDQVYLLRSRLEAAGQLKDVPYQAEFANFAGAAPLLEALNAGAVDTGVAGDIPAIFAAAAGVPLKIVGVGRSSARDIGIIVPKGSKIANVAGLRGHKVIVSTARGSISHYLLLAALEEAGVPVNEVEIGFLMPNDAAAAFAAGQIEAWAIFGIYQAKAEAEGARVLRTGEGINTGLGVIAASEKALADPVKRTAIADYLVRLRKANEWCAANPEAYAKIFAERTGVSVAIARTIVGWQNPLFLAPTPDIVAQLQATTDKLHSFGVLAQPVDIASITDPSLAPA
ncbi:ABC transporter substrate-binding protein [Asticcacaulis sp. BYS171W]|uniref:ABC transporter substrate-binding protein n=1 Tax=Asticcacaulis aquaticus TaxID=2984212 RepID=A0ABT5HUP1_9CAUL|nr:ABC transporter substrate-binding protein [Asticcacaulis aquaticus]MDC7683764.1 ABC transporter substrate-binding protein [Asticcacaulis aquaticus]